jgi:hypothetical protein
MVPKEKAEVAKTVAAAASVRMCGVFMGGD